tara:strand:- start:1987 stop:2151 length:165 start_codon:yes stop_codon:yes gene_type:complete
MPYFKETDQYLKKPVREQAPQPLAIAPLTHRYNPDHIFRAQKKIPINAVRGLNK